MSALPNDTYKPETDNRNASHAILILTANNTEDLEFFYPYYRFIEAGFKVDVATPNGGELKAKQGLGLKETKNIMDVDPAKYDLLYIPGGKAPAELRKNAAAIALTQQFVSRGKPVAAICHGPQVLAAARVIEGRKIAAWPEIKPEISEAGACYQNNESVVDGQFITARWPGDLPNHLRITLEMLDLWHEKDNDVIEHAAA